MTPREPTRSHRGEDESLYPGGGRRTEGEGKGGGGRRGRIVGRNECGLPGRWGESGTTPEHAESVLSFNPYYFQKIRLKTFFSFLTFF